MILKYIWNIFISLDQFLNVLLFGAPDELFSSRVGRAIKSGKPKKFVWPIYYSLNFIFKIIKKDKNHSIESIEPDYAKEDELWTWIKNEHD